MTYKIFMSLILEFLSAAFADCIFNYLFLTKVFAFYPACFFYSDFNWGILGTIGTSISAAKILSKFFPSYMCYELDKRLNDGSFAKRQSFAGSLCDCTNHLPYNFYSGNYCYTFVVVDHSLL